jgi:hypothetical protein
MPKILQVLSLPAFEETQTHQQQRNKTHAGEHSDAGTPCGVASGEAQGQAEVQLSKRRLAVAQQRLRILRAAWNVWKQYPDATQTNVARGINCNGSKFSTLLNLASKFMRGSGRLNGRERCRRLLFGQQHPNTPTLHHSILSRLAPPESKRDDVDFLPAESEVAIVRSIYARLDESTPRGRGRGSSKIVAFRIAAKSEEYQDKISQLFRDTVLKRRTKSVPPSWAHLLDVPASVPRAVRDRFTVTIHSISTPPAFLNVAVQSTKPVRVRVLETKSRLRFKVGTQRQLALAKKPSFTIKPPVDG